MGLQAGCNMRQASSRAEGFEATRLLHMIDSYLTSFQLEGLCLVYPPARLLHLLDRAPVNLLNLLYFGS